MPLEIWMILNAFLWVIVSNVGKIIMFEVKLKTCLHKLKNMAWSPSSIEVLDKHHNYPLNTSRQLPQATVCSVIQHTWQQGLKPLTISLHGNMISYAHARFLNVFLWINYIQLNTEQTELNSCVFVFLHHLCLNLFDVKSQSANIQEIMRSQQIGWWGSCKAIQYPMFYTAYYQIPQLLIFLWNAQSMHFRWATAFLRSSSVSFLCVFGLFTRFFS